MKVLAPAFALVLLVIATITVWSSLGTRRGRPAASAAAPAGPAEPDEQRLERLEQRLEELALELGGLRAELDRLGMERRLTLPEAAPEEPAPAPAGAESPTPRWYLEQYVASFAGSGRGSEYFRLAVEAYAPSLLQQIGALVLDPAAHPGLRLALVAMLGDPRFAGDERALALLLRLVSSPAQVALVEVALEAIGRNGDAGTARALERLLWSLAGPVQVRAVRVLVQLAGAEGNAALLRLFPAAQEESLQALLVSLLQPGEWPNALGVFELASLAEKNVRLQAASQIGRFRFPEVRAFVDSWIAREPDTEVRAALGEAQGTLARVPPWHAGRAAGPPDANNLADDQNAWASLRANMGEQWLELVYDPPLAASSVRIFEVCVAGAVVRVTGIDERGSAHVLWSGLDPTVEPGVLELAFPATPYRVRALRLTLDTDLRPGWSEIDAVELIGPQGRAWASTATASSSYGE
jgi:hypothetical protein